MVNGIAGLKFETSQQLFPDNCCFSDCCLLWSALLVFLLLSVVFIAHNAWLRREALQLQRDALLLRHALQRDALHNPQIMLSRLALANALRFSDEARDSYLRTGKLPARLPPSSASTPDTSRRQLASSPTTGEVPSTPDTELL